MAYLAYMRASEVNYFSGSQYVNPELGTHKFYIRTGTGNDDVIKYGLTSQSSASKYCGFKFKVSNMDIRIGRYEGFSSTESILKTTSGKQYYSQSYRSFKGNYQVTSSNTHSNLNPTSYQSTSSSNIRVENGVNITELLTQSTMKQYAVYSTMKQSFTSGYYSSVSSLYSSITSTISKIMEQSGNPNFDL